jgi:hypothetical protein
VNIVVDVVVVVVVVVAPPAAAAAVAAVVVGEADYCCCCFLARILFGVQRGCCLIPHNAWVKFAHRRRLLLLRIAAGVVGTLLVDISLAAKLLLLVVLPCEVAHAFILPRRISLRL